MLRNSQIFQLVMRSANQMRAKHTKRLDYAMAQSTLVDHQRRGPWFSSSYGYMTLTSRVEGAE